jgi:hypothetical protein
MISQRPAEAADRAVPGHWEGDLILGLGSSAIGTLVERTTRVTLLLHLPRKAGHSHEARVKNGPPLAGHGAEAVRNAITRTIVTLPEQLHRSLTWDQGADLAQHARLKIDAGMQAPTRLQPWQLPSTPGRERRSIGRHLQKCLTSCFYRPTKMLLRRPLESAQWTLVSWAIAGDLPLARMAAMPPDADRARTLRRAMRAMISSCRFHESV